MSLWSGVWHAPTTTQAERKQLLRYLNEVGSRRGAVCRSDSPGKDTPESFVLIADA